MIADLRQQVDLLGPVDAILIGGDIAYKGAADEYGAALEWIISLSEACKCPIGRVYTVPGNHDVDRKVVSQNLTVQNTHGAIISAKPDMRERTFRAQFANPDTGKALILPITEYNKFASRFECQIFAPDRLYWRQNIPLAADITLRLHGLTSTILSGKDGSNDVKGSLYLSPLQTALDPEDNVVNLVMCHHPPDWFMDHDMVEDAMNGRAAIQLFGHKHAQRIIRDEYFVRIGAAAVNPDRYEAGFDPGYNLVNLTISGEGLARNLTVAAYLRHWQTHPEGYRARMDGEESVFRRSIAFPDRRSTCVTLPAGLDGEGFVMHPAAVDDREVVMDEETTRNLVYRFWNLRTSQRREITLLLGLINEGDISVDEPERYHRAFVRAAERNQIDALACEVAKREKR